MHNLVYAQTDYNSILITDTLKINFNNRYSISQVNIIPNTEQIYLKGRILRPKDYNFIFSKGYFTLSDSLPYSIYDTLIVTYRTLKLSLQKEYKRRTLTIKYDDKFGDTVRVLTSTGSGFTPETIFGPGIQKSGTLIRGFTVGTTKDFSLNSGLRLQLSGRISEDVEIVAALTDENTPIQSEGNTERLEELDKVFIQIKHPNVIGTFGDYQLAQRYGEFGVINRKLQGLLGEFLFSDANRYLALATAGGKFNTNNFNGLDGIQGPYRLNGINNEKDIVIIAGTEKVFIDGIEMRRGENNDYTIEYSYATITFTPNRLITSASRISVDFEYTDRKFTRNFFGAGSSGKFFNDILQIKFQYLQEGDDQDAPIEIALSEEDKNLLINAGDDRNKASKSGVRLAEQDSLGIRIGIYTKIDTLINGDPFSYYLYAPGDSLSFYNVSFSYVGEQKGDYIRQSLGYYKFVGIGQGNYLPIIFLPLPELKQMGNFVANINPAKNISLNLELAGSLWDKNRFSSIDDDDNFGYAQNIFLKINPSDINIGSINLGKAGLSYRDRFVQSKFTSLDRYNEIEYDRNYNISQQSQPQDESLRELGINLQPIDELVISSTAGFLRKGDDFSSDRVNNFLRLTNQKDYFVEYNLDYVKSDNFNLTSSWFRHKANGYYNLGDIKSGIEFLAEDKVDKTESSDSLISGSLKYFDYAPYIEFKALEGFNVLAKYSFRDDYLAEKGLMEKESRSLTPSLDLIYNALKEFTTDLTFAYRSRKYEEAFKEKGLLDNETILLRSRSKFMFWESLLNGDLYYETSSQRSAKLQKVFVRVEEGKGNYIYLGDLNNNGIADEFEFQLTLFDGDYIQITLPTDELFPVLDLKTSTRWKINFSKITDDKSFIGKIIKPLTTETVLRIEENQRDESGNIFLIDFSSFQNEQTTIRGVNYFQQDFFLFENQQDLSFRFRFTQRKALNEFSGGYERYYNRERSLRIKFKMVQEISNQTDIVNQIDNAGAPENTNRTREINSNSITSEFSYRPDKNVEIGFRLKVGRSEDLFPVVPTIIDLNSQLIRLNISFLSTGRLRIEIERSELNAKATQNFIPFELTNGNQLGKNYFWRLNFDYRLTSFLQATMSYDGRLQGTNRVVHTMRAEARAYF
jgi:hypothetical protein